jgi:hypothetical protein
MTVFRNLLDSLVSTYRQSIEDINSMKITHACDKITLWSNNPHEGVEELIKIQSITRIISQMNHYSSLIDQGYKLSRLVNTVQIAEPVVTYSSYYMLFPESPYSTNDISRFKSLKNIGAAFRSLGKNQIDHCVLLSLTNLNMYRQHLSKMAKYPLNFNITSADIHRLHNEVRGIVQKVVKLLDSFPNCAIITQLKLECKNALFNNYPIAQYLKWIACIIERSRFVLLNYQPKIEVCDEKMMWIVSTIAIAMIDNFSNWGKKLPTIWKYLIKVGLVVTFDDKSTSIFDPTIIERLTINIGDKISLKPSSGGFRLTIPTTYLQFQDDPPIQIVVASSTKQTKLNDWKNSNVRYLKNQDMRWNFNSTLSISKQITDLHMAIFGTCAFININTGVLDEKFTNSEFDLMHEYGVDVHD